MKDRIVWGITIALIILGAWGLYYLLRRISKKQKIRKALLEDVESDINETAKNIALSISKARPLYKTLIAKVHPDRFEEKYKEEATEISARITKAKRNYNDLLNLKNEVEAFIKRINS
jgi:hypothetical protein